MLTEREMGLTWVGSKVVGTLGPSRMGGPMSTHTCPSSSREGCISPAQRVHHKMQFMRLLSCRASD